VTVPTNYNKLLLVAQSS